MSLLKLITRSLLRPWLLLLSVGRRSPREADDRSPAAAAAAAVSSLDPRLMRYRRTSGSCGSRTLVRSRGKRLRIAASLDGCGKCGRLDFSRSRRSFAWSRCLTPAGVSKWLFSLSHVHSFRVFIPSTMCSRKPRTASVQISSPYHHARACGTASIAAAIARAWTSGSTSRHARRGSAFRPWQSIDQSRFQSYKFKIFKPSSESLLVF